MLRDPVRLFCTDLEGTLLGLPDAVERFAVAWNSIPRGVRPLLVYNTNRAVRDTRESATARGLPEADYILGALGTELFATLYDVEGEFRAQFRKVAWDLDRISAIVSTFSQVHPQPPELSSTWKSSWYWDHARPAQLGELAARLQAAGLPARIEYSCRHFLDIVPTCAGKGNALSWLCRRLGIPLTHVLVAGDSAPDASLFQLDGIRGILVANALPELRNTLPPGRIFPAKAEQTDGVLEGFRNYGLI